MTKYCHGRTVLTKPTSLHLYLRIATTLLFCLHINITVKNRKKKPDQRSFFVSGYDVLLSVTAPVQDVLLPDPGRGRGGPGDQHRGAGPDHPEAVEGLRAQLHVPRPPQDPHVLRRLRRHLLRAALRNAKGNGHFFRAE